MQRYREFSPTPFDHAGLGAERLEIGDWFVLPVSQTRDSGPLDQSNFASALQALGGESDTVQVHRFGHWGPGWFEIIVINPTDAARVVEAERLIEQLENYPILDEDDLSFREYDRAAEYWAQCSIAERVEICQRYDVCIFAARHDEIPSDPRGELISYLAE